MRSRRHASISSIWRSTSSGRTAYRKSRTA
jgi:hypothetical protein